MVGIFDAVRGDGKGLNAHVETNGGSGGGQRVNFHICTAQGDEILAARTAGNSCRQDTSLDLLGNTAFHFAQFWKLYAVIKHLDVAIRLVTLMPVSLTFESGETYRSTTSDTTKEILIRVIQMLQRILKSAFINFSQPCGIVVFLQVG